MKTCLVTGASGFLGRHVVRRLARDRHVVGLTHRTRQPGLVSLDLREGEHLARLLDELSPDEVVHLAAYRQPDFCEDDRAETWRLNVDPVLTFVERLAPRCREQVSVGALGRNAQTRGPGARAGA